MGGGKEFAKRTSRGERTLSGEKRGGKKGMLQIGGLEWRAKETAGALPSRPLKPKTKKVRLRANFQKTRGSQRGAMEKNAIGDIK